MQNYGDRPAYNDNKAGYTLQKVPYSINEALLPLIVDMRLPYPVRLLFREFVRRVDSARDLLGQTCHIEHTHVNYLIPRSQTDIHSPDGEYSSSTHHPAHSSIAQRFRGSCFPYPVCTACTQVQSPYMRTRSRILACWNVLIHYWSYKMNRRQSRPHQWTAKVTTWMGKTKC